MELKTLNLKALLNGRAFLYFTDDELTLALESDVGQSIVRASTDNWRTLAWQVRETVRAVDGEVYSNIPEVDTKPEDWEETIWGTDPSDPEVFMYVASILMDVAPVAGTVKSVVELFTGRDLITNEEIPLWLAAGGVIGSFVPGGKGAVRGVAKVLKGGGKAKIVSKISNDSALIKHAELAGKSHQRSIDNLVLQISQGNLNPGIGTKHLFSDVFEARARDGARVYFSKKANVIEILGKSTKSNQEQVINNLRKTYSK